MKRTILTTLLAVALLASNALCVGKWTSITEKVEKSLYRITMTISDEEGMKYPSACTGFSINEEDGLVSTAAHCLGEDEKADGQPAQVVFVNPTTDLMVLKVDKHKPALHPAMNQAQTGDDILAFGYGYGFMKPMARSGHVAIGDIVVNEIKAGEHFLVSDFAYVGGMSGGPVVNEDGDVVSVCQNGSENTGFGRTLTEYVSVLGFFVK